jgi:hypothetical protein
LFWSECGVAEYRRAADLMLLCPVSCHPLKLGMEIAGAKVAVSGGHLDTRMAEDSAQVIKVASISIVRRA